MPVIEEGIEQLQQEFAEAKIPTDEPGFYEDPAFIRREAKVPHYLDNYARFVQQQPYSLTYLDRAEPIIHVVSEELQLALKEDGTPEAHAEATFVMSRILEREGVWNYVASGSLAHDVPDRLGLRALLISGVQRAMRQGDRLFVSLGRRPAVSDHRHRDSGVPLSLSVQPSVAEDRLGTERRAGDRPN